MIDLKGAILLITGGTGSYGSALAHYLLKELPEDKQPDKVVCLSRKWQDQKRLEQKIGSPKLRTIIGDVRDEGRLETAFFCVDYVIHASAIKDLPTAEYNPIEALLTNCVGTANVLGAAWNTGVERVLLISTDKVGGPSFYGATKKVAEGLTVDFNNYTGRYGTQSLVARWGNVAGSSGSVIPHFRSLIENQVPLTITDPNMTRFWITMRQAAEFSLRCLLYGGRGEILVPHLKSCTVEELSDVMAPGQERIISGQRPSERAHEILISYEESLHTTDLEWAYCIYPETPLWDRSYQPEGLPIKPANISSETAERLARSEIEEMLRSC